jgi:nicotinamidase-related amidase
MPKNDELRLGPEMIGLVPDLAKYVPPARTFDKHVYSPRTGTDLHQQLRNAGIDTVIITGGETDECVLATVLGAIDWGLRVILVTMRFPARPTKPTTHDECLLEPLR